MNYCRRINEIEIFINRHPNNKPKYWTRWLAGWVNSNLNHMLCQTIRRSGAIPLYWPSNRKHAWKSIGTGLGVAPLVSFAFCPWIAWLMAELIAVKSNGGQSTYDRQSSSYIKNSRFECTKEHPFSQKHPDFSFPGASYDYVRSPTSHVFTYAVMVRTASQW